MIRNRELALGLFVGLCVGLFAAAYAIVQFVSISFPFVERAEVQMIGNEAFVTATINTDAVGFIFMIGFLAATLFILGCYLIVNWLYPVKRIVVVQK